MKKYIIIVFLLFLNISFLSAQPEHEQLVHQHIVREAWNLLKLDDPGLQNVEMNNWIGYNGTSGPWAFDNERVVAGAYREDEDDVIYNYICPNIPGPWFDVVTSTHFWKCHDIDNVNDVCSLSGFCFVPWWCNPPGNLWHRMSKYINGYWNLERQYPSIGTYFKYWYNHNQNVYVESYGPIGLKYKGLVEGTHNLYHTGYMEIISYYNILGRKIVVNPPVPIFLETSRKYFVYEILGRMAHCLADMSVPAHVHCDPHPDPCGDGDTYELRMGIEFNNFHAGNTGGQFINPFTQSTYHPIKYLSYAMLRIASFFPSNDENPYPYATWDPFNILQGAPQLTKNIFLNHTAYGTGSGNFNIIAHYCMKSCIRMTAGLLKWFLVHTNQVPPPSMDYPTITSNLPSYGNSFILYKTVTGYFSAYADGATAYEYEYYVCNPNNPPGSWPITLYGLNSSSNPYQPNIYIQNQSYWGPYCPSDLPDKVYLWLRVKASNAWDTKYSAFSLVKPATTLPPGGCPWLYVHDSIDYLPDNNILHRSEFPENVGNDITDKYVLKIPPFFNDDPTDNTCSIKIQETEDSYSYFDNFKLLAVDHPLGSNVAVTENNDIVIYYPDPTSPTLALNDGEDVTAELQYGTPETVVEGDEGYLTTAEYSYGDNYRLKLKEKIYGAITSAYKGYRNTLKERKGLGDSSPGDTVALIFDPYDSDINSIVSKAHESGIITAFDYDYGYESEEKPFAKRQYRSDVVIPLDQNLGIDFVTIDWNLDYAMSFLSLSTFFYDGYVEEELELMEATKDGEDLIPQLMDIDGESAEMDNTADIILKFQKPTDSLQAGWVRDYVFITTGRYDAAGGDNPPANNPISSNNISPKEYKLHQNYPNPFNPATRIKYDIPKDGEVTFKIYDLLGKEVYSYANFMKAGYYSFDFNASHLASGVYFYMIKSGDFTKTKKMLFVK